jgi:hypothetical protein
MKTRVAIMNLERILILALFVVGQSRSPASQSDVKGPNSESITLNLCQLLSNPENFYGKKIRVKATFRRLISNEAVMLNKDCDKTERAVSVGYEKTQLDRLSQEMDNALNAWRADEAEVTVVGRFHGPLSGKTEFNYGHMGRYKYQLEITRLEQIKRLDEK